MVLVSSGEQIPSLIFLTYAAPQVLETLFYFFFFPHSALIVLLVKCLSRMEKPSALIPLIPSLYAAQAA